MTRANSSPRLLVFGLLVAWTWKYAYWSSALVYQMREPLEVPFFPSLLQRNDVLAFALLTPVFVGAWAVCTSRQIVTAFCVFAAASLLCLLHQASYNDATFVMTFWVALYGAWLTRALRRGPRVEGSVPVRAAMLAQLLIGFWFFSGAVGKLTPGFLSGDVLYDIYFRDRAYPTFRWARSIWQGQALHDVARAYSLFALLIEMALATVPFWRARSAMIFAIVAMGAICVLNNVALTSVFAAPIAMCLAVLRVVEWRDAASPQSALREGSLITLM